MFNKFGYRSGLRQVVETVVVGIERGQDLPRDALGIFGQRQEEVTGSHLARGWWLELIRQPRRRFQLLFRPRGEGDLAGVQVAPLAVASSMACFS